MQIKSALRIASAVLAAAGLLLLLSFSSPTISQFPPEGENL